MSTFPVSAIVQFIGKDVVVPLEEINISAEIYDGVGRFTNHYTFRNTQSYAINPIHYFALASHPSTTRVPPPSHQLFSGGSNSLAVTSLTSSPTAVVNSFRMIINNEKVFEGEIKEKSEARSNYEAAVSEGKKTSLLEKISDTEYKVSVGNVKSGERIDIIVEYVMTLACDLCNRYACILPMNIAMKYSQSSVPVTPQDLEYIKAMSALKYSADPSIQTKSNIKIRWRSSNAIRNIESLSNRINVSMHSMNDVEVTSQSTAYAGDFNLFAKIDEGLPSVFHYHDVPAVAASNTASSEAHKKQEAEAAELSEEAPSHYFLVSTRVPNQLVTSDDKAKSASVNRKEYFFLLDRSGSMGCSMDTTSGMGESKMSRAVSSLKRFVSKIGEDDYFNVVSFGSDYSALWSDSVKANAANKASCLSNISRYDANMGGTELYRPLNDILEGRLINYSQPSNGKESLTEAREREEVGAVEKVVVVLTDGQIDNPQGLYNMIRNRRSGASNVRIFTIGVGDDVDRKLVKELADMTSGVYTVVKDEKSLDSTIDYISDAVNKQYYVNISIDGSSDRLNSLKAMYPNKNYTFLLKCDHEEYSRYLQSGITLRGRNPITGEEVSWTRELDAGKMNDTAETNSPVIKQLYYNLVMEKMDHVMEFFDLSGEERENMKKAIIELSVKHHIMSAHTSFIIVDHSEAEEDLNREEAVDVSMPHYSQLASSGISYFSSHASLSSNQVLAQVQPTIGHCFFVRSVQDDTTLYSRSVRDCYDSAYSNWNDASNKFQELLLKQEKEEMVRALHALKQKNCDRVIYEAKEILYRYAIQVTIQQRGQFSNITHEELIFWLWAYLIRNKIMPSRELKVMFARFVDPNEEYTLPLYLRDCHSYNPLNRTGFWKAKTGKAQQTEDQLTYEAFKLIDKIEYFFQLVLRPLVEDVFLCKACMSRPTQVLEGSHEVPKKPSGKSRMNVRIETETDSSSPDSTESQTKTTLVCSKCSTECENKVLSDAVKALQTDSHLLKQIRPDFVELILDVLDF